MERIARKFLHRQVILLAAESRLYQPEQMQYMLGAEVQSLELAALCGKKFYRRRTGAQHIGLCTSAWQKDIFDSEYAGEGS